MATDPFLALIGLLTIPALGLMNRSFALQMQGPARRVQERIGDVSAVAHESIDGALVVKTLGRERAEVDRFREKAERLRTERVAAGYIRAGFEEALEALPNLAVMLMLAIGAWRVSTGDITLGTLVQVVTLFGLLAWPMRFVGWILSELPRASVGHGRVLEVLEQPDDDRRAPPSPVALPAGPARGPGRGHSRTSFDGASVLDDVCVRRRAERVGRDRRADTGVGKSDARAAPRAARRPVGGRDPDRRRRHPSRSTPAELRGPTSLVFQESFLFATTVAENIALDSGASTDEIERAAAIGQADRFIARAPPGLRHRPRRARAHALRRRAAARGTRPRIGPAASRADPGRRHERVDPSIEAEILAGLRRELETTLIVVAYRLSTIRLADRVLFWRKAACSRPARTSELMASQPGYAAMIRAYERGER